MLLDSFFHFYVLQYRLKTIPKFITHQFLTYFFNILLNNFQLILQMLGTLSNRLRFRSWLRYLMHTVLYFLKRLSQLTSNYWSQYFIHHERRLLIAGGMLLVSIVALGCSVSICLGIYYEKIVVLWTFFHGIV